MYFRYGNSLRQFKAIDSYVRMRLVRLASIKHGRSCRNQTSAERTIQDAITRSAAMSLEVLTGAMDAALRFIDDIELTTHAAEAADFDHWRSSLSAARNDPCPCRSGAKSKRCVHEWGLEAPSFPETFRR